jgi:hypothetical protein
MNYSSELLKIRDEMHCNIVQEATVRTFIIEQTTEGYLEMEEPLRLYLRDYHPYKGNYTSECFVVGVHCESGDLVGEYIDGKTKWIRYTDLTMEELAYLHDYVVQQKQYKFVKYDKENQSTI